MGYQLTPITVFIFSQLRIKYHDCCFKSLLHCQCNSEQFAQLVQQTKNQCKICRVHAQLMHTTYLAHVQHTLSPQFNATIFICRNLLVHLMQLCIDCDRGTMVRPYTQSQFTVTQTNVEKQRNCLDCLKDDKNIIYHV